MGGGALPVVAPEEIGVSPRVGLCAALLATVTMIAAAARRWSEPERARTPPGTI